MNMIPRIRRLIGFASFILALLMLIGTVAAASNTLISCYLINCNPATANYLEPDNGTILNITNVTILYQVVNSHTYGAGGLSIPILVFMISLIAMTIRNNDMLDSFTVASFVTTGVSLMAAGIGIIQPIYPFVFLGLTILGFLLEALKGTTRIY